jgi:signal transduction histidine kinase
MTRENIIFRADLAHRYRETGRVFLWLFLAQWVFAIVLAVVLTPYSWSGGERVVHFHVKLAIGFGGFLNMLPLVLIQTRPTWWLTRHVVACVQMLWSAMFIAISGGRIETHFHVFVSLAFITLYRDWRVVVTATLTVVADHLARGLWWPDSVYGIASPEWWRFLEHAAWMAFEDIVLVLGCVRAARGMRHAAARAAQLEDATTAVEAMVDQRTRELRASLERSQALIDSTNASPFEYDPGSRKLLYLAPRSDVAAEPFRGYRLHRDDRVRVNGYISAFARNGKATGAPIDYRMSTKSGRIAHVRTFLSTRDSDGSVRGVTLDMTQQKGLEFELQQAQKLESVGRLAAGVAHEINTPVQFVGDSIQFVRDGVSELTTIIDRHHAVIEARLAKAPDDELAAALTAEADADLPYLREHIPAAIDRALDGMKRVAVIVQSMKVFAHPDRKEMAPACLNQAIQSTLTISHNEWKQIADLETDYGDLPLVTCHAGEINQAILNIVVNAAHAMHDVAGHKRRGKLTVRTRCEHDAVVISIGDTGGGIPDHVRERMFDPFFTTKPVGKGTGQGLAIAHSVIVDKHHGTLSCETEVGAGTTFVIRLPIAHGVRQLSSAA